MRTYKDITAGPVGMSRETDSQERDGDAPPTVDVNGEALNLTLDSGLTQSETTAAPRTSYSVNRRNGQL